MNKSLLTVAVTVVGLVTSAFATTLNVPGDYATIEAALAAAQSGDEILLAAGEYGATFGAAEGFMITLDKDVTLKGAGAKPSDTVITGGNERQVLKVASSGAVVENLTLKDGANAGSASGAGAMLEMSSGIVTNCLVTGGTYLPLAATGNMSVQSAVWLTGGRLTDAEVKDCFYDLVGNSTYKYTPFAVVYVRNGRLDHCRIHGNGTHHKWLGIVTVEGAEGLVEDCSVYGNKTWDFEYGYRCAAVCAMNKGVVRGTHVFNNTALFFSSVYFGAGAVSTIGGTMANGSNYFAKNTSYGEALVDRCVITNNVYSLNTDVANSRYIEINAGVLIGYKATLRNCLVANNRLTTSVKKSSHTWPAASGVSVASSYGTLSTVESCTVSDNTVCFLANDPKRANGFYPNGAVTNTILNGEFLVPADSTAVFSHCLSSDALAGDGNRAGDPAFVDAAAGNYDILVSSPCRDVGINDENWMPGATDLIGRDRIISEVVDIGCCEYKSSAERECLITVDRTLTATDRPVTLTAAANPSAGVYAYVWTFEKGGVKTVVTNEAAVLSRAFAEVGEYSIGLKVLWGSAQEITGTAESTERPNVSVFARRVYVAVNGGNVEPYDAPEKAARSFAAALPFVYKDKDDPGIVSFAAGTYSGENALDADGDWLLTVNAAVIVEGATDDPSDTVIDSTGRRGVSVTADGAVFRSFKILTPSNHLAKTSYCGYAVDLRNGRVENVEVDSPKTPLYASVQVYEHAVYVADGVLKGLYLHGMRKSYDYLYSNGSGTALLAVGGRVEGCLIEDNEIQDHFAGGVVTLSGTALLTNTVIRGNAAKYCENNTGTFVGFSSGVAAQDSARIADCLVETNVSEGCSFARRSAGILVKDSVAVERCVVRGNRVTGMRPNDNWVVPGLYLRNTTVARNCLVCDNSGVMGNNKKVLAGGVYVEPAARLESSTVVGNIAEGNETASGVCAQGTVLNAIVWDNAFSNDAATVTYSCTPVLQAGAGNVARDPKFRRGYLLKSSSPCRDAGFNQDWMTGAVDLYGNPRIQCDVVDMGCIEMPRASGLMMLVR